MGLREMSYDDLGTAEATRANLADHQEGGLLARNAERCDLVAEYVRSMSSVPNGRPNGADEEHIGFIAP